MKYIKTFEKYSLDNIELYILGINENNKVNEGVIDRLKSMSRKGLLTTTLLTSLMSNSGFAKEYNKLEPSERAKIEASVKGNISSNIIDVSSEFKSGVYKITPNTKEEIFKKLTQINDYINNTGKAKFTIKIISSESQVPNRDAETRQVLETGILAKKRGEEVSKVLKEYLKKNISEEKVTIKILENENIIGKEEWNPDVDRADDEKYTKEQYVRIIITPVDFVTPCSIQYTPKSGTQGEESKDYITYKNTINVEGMYGTGVITLTPGSIPDRVQVLADGAVIEDSGYFADMTHPLYPQYKFLPSYIEELTKLSNSGTKALSDSNKHKTIKIKFNNFDELVEYMLVTNPQPIRKGGVEFDWHKDTRELSQEGINGLREMWKKGQREFVFFELKQIDVKYTLNGEYKEITVLVYSPLGDTGYTISGQCK